MRISKFIVSNIEEILTEWVSFAGTVVPEKKLSRLTLRNDAEHILRAIALDMETAQTAREQIKKSQGRGPREEQRSAAESHAAARFGVGFDQVEIISEFRALRATVIRLWKASLPEIDDSAMDELVRFNEGIDQALMESSSQFMEEIRKSRDFAMGVLAHDLRNPLNSILTSAEYLQRLIAEGRDSTGMGDIGSSIIASGSHMTKLINDLLDFTRTRAGQPLPVKKKLTDLGRVCQQTVEELRTACLGRTIRLNCSGVLEGFFDATRISQMLENLIANAIQHGRETTPVTITLRVESEEIVVRIHNDGPPIPPSELSTIWDFSGPTNKVHTDSGHLGLGLYIVREIVNAHLGKINVTSTEKEGTTFVVRLPRR